MDWMGLFRSGMYAKSGLGSRCSFALWRQLKLIQTISFIVLQDVSNKAPAALSPFSSISPIRNRVFTSNQNKNVVMTPVDLVPLIQCGISFHLISISITKIAPIKGGRI